MKKILIILCMYAMALLSACSSGTNSNETASASVSVSNGPSTMETEGKIFEQKFGDMIYYYRTNSITSVTSKVSITLSNPESVKERGNSDSSALDTDYVKVFVQTENVGDGNSYDSAISWSSFKTYDANGKEISKLTWIDKYMEDEFEPTELRPGGKNEGFMFIPIEEGTVPAEIIYFDSGLRGSYTNQFVFKL